jgi:hypothetical protein
MSEGTEAVASESFESFDSFDATEVAEDFNEDWGKPEPEAAKPVKEKVSEDLKTLDDSNADSDGDVIEDKAKITKKDVKEEEDEEEVEEEEPLEDQNTEKVPEDMKDKKNLRMRMGDDLFNISNDASFKVKIDGKMEDVNVQELLNNYSGKTAWDKKFTEIGKEKKALEQETKQITAQKEALFNHLNNILDPIKDPTKNPIDSILYLVEMSGEDPYTAYRRLMEHNLDELGSLMEMGETERELYFHKKKDDLHANVAKKRQEKQSKEEAFNQAVQKTDSLRQAYNVTEDEYVEASQELFDIYEESKLDVSKITQEVVVDFASLKVHIETVKELTGPYLDNIADGKYGEVVTELARLVRDGKADVAEVKKILARNFSVEEDVKELNSKVYQKNQKISGKKATLNEDSELSESFSDWD